MKKHKPMSATEFIKGKNKILAKIEKYKKNVSAAEYKPLYTKYILDNCNYCIRKVYELEKNGRKRKGFSRFVIYDLVVTVIHSRFALIEACGWWLDQDNNASKWDQMTVFGSANNAVLKLSDNQKNNKPKNS